MSRNSATVLALRDYRSRHRTLYFTRGELNQLLGLYSRHVARGVWRDYAIDPGRLSRDISEKRDVVFVSLGE